MIAAPMSIARTVLREQVKEVLLERILRGELEPGESVDLVAVRTGQHEQNEKSARHVLPPQVSVEVVERSGMRHNRGSGIAIVPKRRRWSPTSRGSRKRPQTRRGRSGSRA